MRFTLKQIISGVALASYVAWDNFGKPIWTSNVERWAEKRNLDQALNNIEGPVMPDWVIDQVNFLTGDFLIGVASIAALLLFVDITKLAANGIRKYNLDRIAPDRLIKELKGYAKLIKGNSEYLSSNKEFITYLKRDIVELIRDVETYTKYKGLLSELKKKGINDSHLISFADAIEKCEGNELTEKVGSIITGYESPQLPQNTVTETQL